MARTAQEHQRCADVLGQEQETGQHGLPYLEVGKLRPGRLSAQSSPARAPDLNQNAALGDSDCVTRPFASILTEFQAEGCCGRARVIRGGEKADNSYKHGPHRRREVSGLGRF